jgi:Xaa-Pro aminopeptidase
MTEKELAIELDFTMLRLGADGNSFDTIIASGENGSLCHAIPGPRKLRRGDMITMDYGCKVGGYCSDMTRTVALGEPSAEMRRVYDTVLAAQEMAQAALAPARTASTSTRSRGTTSTARATRAVSATAWATRSASTSTKAPGSA